MTALPRASWLAVALTALAAGGCMPDDWDGTPYTGPADPVVDTHGDTDTADPVADGIVGTWVSSGSDLSELFAGDPFRYVEVSATFRGDGSYLVTSRDDGGTTYPLTGTYTVDEATDPARIALQQDDPYQATAKGIWQVQGDVLTYEVVQTTPDYGFSPPTPDGGFGSTSGPGLDPGLNIQVYRRDR